MLQYNFYCSNNAKQFAIVGFTIPLCKVFWNLKYQILLIFGFIILWCCRCLIAWYINKLFKKINYFNNFLKISRKNFIDFVARSLFLVLYIFNINFLHWKNVLGWVTHHCHCLTGTLSFQFVGIWQLWLIAICKNHRIKSADMEKCKSNKGMLWIPRYYIYGR